MKIKDKEKVLKIIVALFLLITYLPVFLLGYTFGKKQDKVDAPSLQEQAINSQLSGGEEATALPDETAENTEKEELKKEIEGLSQDETVEKIMAEMSLSDMVYQMMFVRPESITGVGQVVQAGPATKKALSDYPVGGIVYFSENLQNKDQTMEMINKTQGFSKIPLFISVDEEGGRVSRLGDNSQMGTTKHPPMLEIGNTKDAKKAYDVGATLAKELGALGFNMDFAPIADVLVDSKTTEIGDRSFGTDPENVAQMVKKAVGGMQENGLSATLKHFPGHGSASANSHHNYASSTRTLEEFRQTEFVPFVAGIEAGADFIMISHMTLENATIEKVPSSVSKEVITDMLKNELGYSGIIITDSFEMGAITNKYTSSQAAVKAVNAGVDMILMPMDLKASHDAIVAAVKSGEISEERIKESVKKIISLKVKKGLF